MHRYTDLFDSTSICAATCVTKLIMLIEAEESAEHQEEIKATNVGSKFYTLHCMLLATQRNF